MTAGSGFRCKEGGKAGCENPIVDPLSTASSRLSDNEGKGKIGPNKEKKEGRGGGGKNERKACKTSLMDRFWYTCSWYTL